MHTIRSSDCISGGGVSAPRGCLFLEGVCSRGVSALGGVCSWGVVSSWGGGCQLPGGSALWGVVSQHALRQTPPPPCGQTDACENITFATSLQTVIKALAIVRILFLSFCEQAILLFCILEYLQQWNIFMQICEETKQKHLTSKLLRFRYQLQRSCSSALGE